MADRSNCLNVQLSELARADDLDSVKNAMLRVFRNMVLFITALEGDGVWIDVDGRFLWHRGPDRAGKFPCQVVAFAPGAAVELIFDARGHAMMVGGWEPGTDRILTTDYQTHLPQPIEPDRAIEGQDPVHTYRYITVRETTVPAGWVWLTDQTYTGTVGPARSCPAIVYENGIVDFQRRDFYAFSVDGSDDAEAKSFDGPYVGIQLRCAPDIANDAAVASDQVITVVLDWITESFNTGGAIAWGSQPATDSMTTAPISGGVAYYGQCLAGDTYHATLGGAGGAMAYYVRAEKPTVDVYGIRVSVALTNPLAANTSIARCQKTGLLEAAPEIAVLDGISA